VAKRRVGHMRAENPQAVRDGAHWMGLFYVMGSVLAGYLAVWLGALLTSRG